MKDNKTIGFDILDNAGLDKIDQIGTDTDMLDEKTKKRILEMTRKRFNDAIKGEDMMTFNNDINESAEIVENVEVYKRSKISKIMTRVINTAAVAGIAAGSVFLVKNINKDNKPVEPDLPAVSSTEDGELTAEEKARNQRIEEYIQELYNQFGMSDEDEFYDSLKVDYAYLDINNDSVDELFIRYDFNAVAADAKGIALNYFDGRKYVHSINVRETFKIDLNNRKLYDLAESHEGERWLDINTWENVEFSADSDFFTLQDNYFEIIDSFAENTYTHNNEPCTKEEYDKAIAEYENCVGAELKFFPYDVKKAAKQPTANLSNEAAANQRIEDFIRHIYVSHNEVLDKETFDETLKIEYAYLDLNNDSTDELLIRYNFCDMDYSGIMLNYYDGTEYKEFRNVEYASKFDLQNCKIYDVYYGHEYEGIEDEFYVEILTWENTGKSFDEDYYFTHEETYHYYLHENNLYYTHNGKPCTEEELKTAKAKYENCDNAGIEYISYIPDDSFFLGNSVNTTANGQSAEETARNKRIEEYIEYLCYYCDGESDKDKFYDTIKIDYAYLDINNDSVDELLIRYHNLNDFSPYYEGTEINYFDGTKYIPVGETNTTFKFDLQNRKLYQLSEGHEGGYWLCVRTWDEFSDDTDFFTLTDNYTSDIISFEPLGYTYSHNDTECSKEEYEKAMDEYENCVGAELKFVPYNVKKTVSSTVQTQAVATNNEETIQTTIATTNKPTQEVLDKARDAALKARFDKHDKNNYVSMFYAYYDIYDDSVPELLVSNEYNINREMEIYKFNGAEFVFKTAVCYSINVKFCTSEKLLVGYEKMSSMIHSITRYDDEFNFSKVNRVFNGYYCDENGNGYDQYRFNDQIITKEEFDSYMHECDSCEMLSNNVEFLFYKTNSPNYNEKLAREQLINDLDPEGVYDSINYSYIELNDDGKSELIILCDDYDTNKATFNIYHWENNSYVLKKNETNFTFKIDLDNKRIYFADDFSGTVEFMYYLTWDENCNMKFVKQAYAGDEGFEELLAEYEACEDIYLDYIPY
ncbi:MAG: hypothetical protein IJN43_12400 [Ruminococcus sp.]|nr:hypothetical protein [Ruminococcus sp.]